MEPKSIRIDNDFIAADQCSFAMMNVCISRTVHTNYSIFLDRIEFLITVHDTVYSGRSPIRLGGALVCICIVPQEPGRPAAQVVK